MPKPYVKFLDRAAELRLANEMGSQPLAGQSDAMRLGYEPRMDTPRSMEISSTLPIVGRLIRGVVKLDSSTQLAIVCIVFGWFFLNTLVVSLGSLQHGVRFFDMAAVIGDPTRLFFGVDSWFQRLFFGLVCLLCVSAPLAPQLSRNRFAWLAFLAPLVLLLLCALLLYSRTSSDLFAVPSDTKSWSGNLMNFANDVARRGGGMVSRHIALGAGGYLAFIGSAVLAVQGLRRFRRRA